MMNKERKKFLRRWLGWIFIKSLITINGTLPLGWGYFCGKIFGKIVYFALAHHRRVTLNSLSVALPNLSLKERKKIAKNFFIFMAQSFLETLYFVRKPHNLKNIRIEGRQNLDNALKKGKGVILLTAHLGAFPLMVFKLAEEGYTVSSVLRSLRDQRANNYIHNLRENAGIKTIYTHPRRECVNGILKALRNNGSVMIQMDQNFGTGGVWVKFFGKLAATPVGPIIFALRTDAAVVPAYIWREAKGKHCIRIFPQEELIKTSDKDKTVLLNAIKFTRIIESWVKEFPSQWGWVHRRWKSRPSEEIKKLKFKIEG